MTFQMLSLFRPKLFTSQYYNNNISCTFVLHYIAYNMYNGGLGIWSWAGLDSLLCNTRETREEKTVSKWIQISLGAPGTASGKIQVMNETQSPISTRKQNGCTWRVNGLTYPPLCILRGGRGIVQGWHLSPTSRPNPVLLSPWRVAVELSKRESYSEVILPHSNCDPIDVSNSPVTLNTFSSLEDDLGKGKVPSSQNIHVWKKWASTKIWKFPIFTMKSEGRKKMLTYQGGKKWIRNIVPWSDREFNEEEVINSRKC